MQVAEYQQHLDRRERELKRGKANTRSSLGGTLAEEHPRAESEDCRGCVQKDKGSDTDRNLT